MTTIQLFLICAFLFTALYYFVRLRNRVADVIMLFLLVATAILFILFPSWTNLLAQKMGVGRGADLIFYLCIVTFCFVLLKLYSKMRTLEQQITELIRNQAIKDAETKQ